MTPISEKDFPNPAHRQAAQYIASGNIAGALSLAQSLPDGVNTTGPNYDTLLITALKAGRADAVKSLIEAGADPNVPATRAPISVAVATADLSTIRFLLEVGANPNGTSNGQSALWRAAEGNRIDVVELLLANHADLDQPDRDGVTPTLAAATIERFKMAEYLLARGADPFASSSHGMTIGTWIVESRAPAASSEGQARQLVEARIRQAGFPWPPPQPKEVVAARKAGRWPPK